MKRVAVLLFAALVSSLTPGQPNFPSRQITIVVPSSPGGATDFAARLIAKELTVSLGKPVIVENRPGANTTIANAQVAHAPNDGHTLLLGTTALVQLPGLGATTPYSPSDLVPVSQVANAFIVLVVNADLGVNNIKDLVALSRRTPGGLSWGSSGSGTSSHIYGDYLNTLSGAGMVRVPFKSSVALVSDLVGGHVKVGMVDLATAITHIRSGKLRALSVVGTSRVRQLPAVPTFREVGFAGFEQAAWMGIFVPKGTPSERIDYLSKEIARAVSSPELGAALNGINLEPVGTSSSDFAAVFRADLATWRSIVRTTGTKLQD